MNGTDGEAQDPGAEVLGQILYRFADADWVMQVQRPYVQFFSDIKAKRVLDVGCGRGLFLTLLREAGMEAYGVDSSPEAYAECRTAGHERVALSDALDYLAECSDRQERFDGVFCSHVVEHLPGPQGVRLLTLACDAVAPGGRIVVATPNAANLWILTDVFWSDPTHVQPYPRRLIEAVLTTNGLEIVKSFDNPMTRRAIGGVSGLFHMPAEFLRLGTSLFTGGESVVVAQRP